MVDQARQRKVGILLSYLQMAMNIIVGLVYTPMMLDLLGKSEYGLYSSVVSVISVLSILSLGFGSGYLRYYAIYRIKGDSDSMWKLNGLFLTVFSIIGFVALIIGLIVSANLKLVFDRGLTEAELETARILMILLTVNLAISFPMSVFNTIINANEKFIVNKVVQMGKTVATPLLTIPLLLMGARSIALVVATIVISIAVDIFNILYVFRILKNKFVFKNFEKGLFGGIFAYTFFIMLNTVVRQVNWNVDKIILGRYNGTSVVAVYAVAFSLYVYYENFSASISNVYRTKVHLIVNATKDDPVTQRAKLTEYFITIGRFQFFILGLVSTGLVLFGKSFIINIWVGSEYEEAYYIALLLIIPASISLIQSIGIDVQRALNKHKFRSIAYSVMVVFNIIITVILCQRFGAIGAAVGTAVSIFVVDGIVMNIYYNNQCNIDTHLFWESIARAALGLIPPVIFGVILIQIVDISGTLIFIASVFLYTAVYCASVYFLSLNSGEKKEIHKIFKKFKGRKKYE
jgi:O-antigen/teichoic acid export membrane protein